MGDIQNDDSASVLIDPVASTPVRSAAGGVLPGILILQRMADAVSVFQQRAGEELCRRRSDLLGQPRKLTLSAGRGCGFTGFGGTSRTGLAGHLLRPGVGPGATYPRHIGTARCREAAGDQLNRTKSRLVPVQLIPRSVLAAGGGTPPAARSRQRPLSGAGVSTGGSLVGVYGRSPWRTWAADKVGRDAHGAAGADALVLGAAVLSVRQEKLC